MFIEKNNRLVSVIVLNFNGQKYLMPCLSSLLSNKYPNFEVIFVDNASIDSSVEMVEKAFGNDKRVRIFKNTKNLGFSAGNNFGFSQARGEYVVFLNNDTIADPNWLASLVDVIERDHTIGLAGSTILSIDGKKLRGAGGLWSDYLLYLYPIFAGKVGDFKFIPTMEVSFVSGCSMIARRDFLAEIGLFDPEIPYNYDDTLLSLKTWLAGKKVVTVSSSRICHVGGATTKKFWNKYSTAFSLMRAKICLIFDTYYKFTDLFTALFALYFSILVDSVFLIINSNLPEALANIQASIWVLRNFGHVWTNRLKHWSKSKISPEDLLEKYVRIKLEFPLCATPFGFRRVFYNNACRQYESKFLQAAT